MALTWAQVHFAAGIVRLEPNTTKSDQGRSFPFAALPELAALLQQQRQHTSDLERRLGQVIPYVFHRNGRQIRSYHAAWWAACKRASVEKRGHLETACSTGPPMTSGAPQPEISFGPASLNTS